MPKTPKWNEVRCPKCREPMAPSASRCPHCTTEFSADDVAKRQRGHWLGMAGGLLLLLICIFMLAWCSDRSDQTRNEELPVAAAVHLPRDRTSSGDELSSQALPEIATIPLVPGVPDAPLMDLCRGNRECEISRLRFERQEWPKAWQGDYQAQRNVAFCLKTECGGGVQPIPIQACAWRQIILASGSPKIDRSDAVNLEADCGSLSEPDRRSANAQAEAALTIIDHQRTDNTQ